MSSSAALAAVKDLETYFGKKFTPEQKDFWVRKLFFSNPKDLAAGVDQIKVRSFKDRLPTLEDVLKEVDIARARRSAQEARKEAAEAKGALDPERQSSGIARDCCEFTQGLLARKPSLARGKWRVEQASKLAEKYPHLDWKPELRDGLEEIEKYQHEEQEAAG